MVGRGNGNMKLNGNGGQVDKQWIMTFHKYTDMVNYEQHSSNNYREEHSQFHDEYVSR